MPAQPVVPMGLPLAEGALAGEDGASLVLLHGPGIFSLLPAQPARSSSPSALSQRGRWHRQARSTAQTRKPTPSSLCQGWAAHLFSLALRRT